MARESEPIGVYIGVSRDDRTLRWAKRLGIRLSWSHVFLFFLFGDGNEPVVCEADWHGIRQAEWDKAHQADGYAFYADDRTTPHTVSALWWWCKGNVGKVYEFSLLIRLALRLAWESWRRARGIATGRAGFAEVCSSFVSKAARAVFGEPYVDRLDPTPDEIVANPHLHLEAQG